MAATNISTFNFLLVLFTSVTTIGRSVHICTLAFVPVRRSNNKQRNDKSVSQSYIIRASNPNVSYEYLPPNPDAQPGSFHTPTLKSSYPKGTPAGLRGEAVRSALITTERCVGWDLSTNEESSMGGLLQISGRGTIDFLNGKLTTSIDSNNNNSNNNNNNIYREGCLLDAKGRLVDVLRVCLVDDNRRALVLTSPGHSSADLMKRLDPFVFPMDEVTLTNFGGNSTGNDSSTQSFAFTLASTQYKHVQNVMREQSNLLDSLENMIFPGSFQGVVWKSRNGGEQILVVPSTGLPHIACVGYTFVFFGNKSTNAESLGRKVWNRLISEGNVEGPIEVGALEYETLRVESGQPAYGCEYGIDRTKNEEGVNQEESAVTKRENDGNNQRKKSKSNIIKTSPFELHLSSLIDENKGCYLGQEGIASALKNTRGPPRKLYTVVFEDDFNIYEAQSSGDRSDFDNLTTLPKPGQNLFALGSNEKIKVGSLTSVGEASGTGNRYTVALALIKRSDSILKQMKELELEIPRNPDDFLDVDLSSGSGIIQPPPLDPLECLEVIVEGTFTVGVLKCVPNRRSGMGRNRNMFDEDIQVEGISEHEAELIESSRPSSTVTASNGDNTDSLSTEIGNELKLAAAEAEAAAAEAERKADKLLLLQKRAEAAMAKRKQKKKE